MIKSDLGVEVACVDLGGWDTHAGEGGADGGELPKLLLEFSQGIHAFYTDMGDRMSRTTVVSMSEFGRRLQENNSHGTDHGHGNVMFILGGGIQGGKVYGDWPGLEKNQLVRSRRPERHHRFPGRAGRDRQEPARQHQPGGGLPELHQLQVPQPDDAADGDERAAAAQGDGRARAHGGVALNVLE